MKSKDIIFICTLPFLLLLYSCQKETQYVSELQMASQYVEQSPDSALLYLNLIENPRGLNQEQYASYCLLLTEAMDKTYAVHTSDSLISFAANYFEKKKNINKKAKAWYYMGRVNQDLLQAEKAVDYYLKAIPYAERTNEYRLLALIYNQISNLYRQQKLFEKALFAAQKSYSYCVLTKDSTDISYSLRDIARTYSFINPDSALAYCQKALSYAEQINDVGIQASILNDMGVTYEQMGNYEEALNSMHQAVTIADNDDERNLNHMLLGSLYLKMDKIDLAKEYLEKAYESHNEYIKAGANYYLYSINKNLHNYENALYYYEQYQTKKEAVEQNERKDEVLKLTHEYEQKELKKEMELRTVRERFFYSSCILFLLIVLTIGYFLYTRYRFSRERLLRLRDKQIQYEKELRLLSEEQIKENRLQIESNREKLISKEEALQSIQRDLLNYNTKLLKAENELIVLRREEHSFRNKLFEQSNLPEQIKAAGVNTRKKDCPYKPFTIKNFPELIASLNEVYNHFVDRLQKKYPQLKERDLEICYLLKAGAKTGNIAEIIAMTPNAVTKKKRLILNKMEIIDQEVSLEEFLETF